MAIDPTLPPQDGVLPPDGVLPHEGATNPLEAVVLKAEKDHIPRDAPDPTGAAQKAGVGVVRPRQGCKVTLG